MKMESAYSRAVNRLFSVGVGFIFIAEDDQGLAILDGGVEGWIFTTALSV
jgi:hypothetical protein